MPCFCKQEEYYLRSLCSINPYFFSMECLASMDCLTDDLLIKILSLLPTKEAVSTSLLSKRWRILFAFSHNFDFDDSIVGPSKKRKRYGRKIRKSFNDFMDSSLAFQAGSHIKTFSLKLSDTCRYDPVDVGRWLYYAMEHSVSEFHIRLESWSQCPFPSNVFTSVTLVSLSIGIGLRISSVPSDAYLPALKVLFLNSVYFKVDQLFDVFLAACPALEDLTIHHNYCQYLPSKVFNSTTLVKLSLGETFYINSIPSLPALKVLVLDKISFKGEELFNEFLDACHALEDLTIRHRVHERRRYVISNRTIKRLSVSHCGIISLDTPRVVDLYYADFARPESPYCKFDSLAKATLDLQFVQGGKQLRQLDRKPRRLDHQDVTNLISGISNVKTLHLTSSAVEVISFCCNSELPMFNNLTDLNFSSTKLGWRVFLPLLLERSPNLKTLVLTGLERYTFREGQFVGIRIPLNNQIKMLSIMQCQGGAYELKHISHFLLNLECLEVVKVYVSSAANGLKKMQLVEDLLNLPTASPKVKIQVM